ncbi:hypothetical protein H0Z60_16195 [Ectothiorhodospiraceae bacterium WFHF3C12]|nr:hypothetical protein [Ectothiorhodospiraceae bacterium WFHF3C12]
MRRREFLAISAISISGMVGCRGEDGRLYGVPGSLSDGNKQTADTERLTLPLSKAQLPPRVAEKVARYNRIWRKFIDDPHFRARIFRHPERSKEILALSEVTSDEANEILTLVATWDPTVSRALQDRDYHTYLNRVRRYIHIRDHSYVDNSRSAAIRRNIQQHGIQVLEAHGETRKRKNIPIEDFAQGDELSVVAASICGPGAGAAAVAAAVVVVVAAAAATYVSVGVNVTVALNAGVYVNVAVESAVATSGAMRRPTTQVQTLSQLMAQDSLPQLADEGYSALASAAKVAALQGHTDAYGNTLIEIIRREVDTALWHAEDLELVHIHPDHRPSVVALATNYVANIVGLPATRVRC